MLTILFAFFAVSGTELPADYQEIAENSSISYICYAQDGYLQLGRLEKTSSPLLAGSAETGISTKGIEKITMFLEEGSVGLSIRYADREPVRALFETNDLSLVEIGIVAESGFATALDE